MQGEHERRVRIAAGHGKAVRLAAGQAVKLINTFGTQVVDCWAWNAFDLTEHMSMEATRVWNQRLNPMTGDSFVTLLRNPILTLVEDTSPGIHDTLMAACDRQRYTLLGVKGYHRNCRDNMYEGMLEIGINPPQPILASFNIFMNIAVLPDGNALDTRAVATKPGDYVVLRAEMDCFVAFSACPQDIVRIQGAPSGKPSDVEFVVLDHGFPMPSLRGPWVPSGS